MTHATRRLAPAAVLGVALAAAPAGPAAAQEIGSPERGQVVAERICAECHAVIRGQRVSPKFLAAPFSGIAATPGLTAMALSASLQTSHRTMPNLILEPQDFSDVIAYLLSLKPAE